MKFGKLRRGHWIGLAAATIFIFSVTTSWPTLWLQAPLIVDEAPRASDVIIVLGGGTRRGSDPLPQQVKDRLARGAEIYNYGYAPAVIVTGGLSRQSGLVEADAMEPHMINHLKIPSQTVFKERQARSTYENALYSKEIMKNHDWKTAIVVTSAYHTFRSCQVFRAFAMDVRCMAAPIDDHGSMHERLINLRSVVREYGAIIYYWIRGKL